MITPTAKVFDSIDAKSRKSKGFLDLLGFLEYYTASSQERDVLHRMARAHVHTAYSGTEIRKTV